MFPLHLDSATEVRLLEPHHAIEVFAAVEQNREHLAQWLPWVAHTLRVEDTIDFLTVCQEEYEAGTTVALGLWHEAEFCGSVGTHGIDTINRHAAIGYWLAKKQEGKGLVTRACRMFIEYLFKERNMHRVEIRCATGNLRSAAIPERLGFQMEGVNRGHAWLNGRFVDMRVYSLLRDEWHSAD